MSQKHQRIETKHPKSKRSLDILETACKHLAGSPDHDLDLDIITLNNAFNNRMNKLTKITNDILNIIKKDNAFDNRIALSLQSKITITKEEIINIKYAIQWARLGIVNSVILDKKKIEVTIKEFKKGTYTF